MTDEGNIISWEINIHINRHLRKPGQAALRSESAVFVSLNVGSTCTADRHIVCQRMGRKERLLSKEVVHKSW